MAKKGNRNYARGRVREEELVRLLTRLDKEGQYTVERAPLSGQSWKNRRDAGYDLRMTYNDGRTVTISVKTGKSIPVGVYRVANQGRGSVVATTVEGPWKWYASVTSSWVKKARGKCDALAVKRPNKPWVYLEESGNGKKA